MPPRLWPRTYMQVLLELENYFASATGSLPIAPLEERLFWGVSFMSGRVFRLLGHQLFELPESER